MTKILHKRSSTIGSAPTTASIDLGELAINTTDGKLFLKKSGSVGESVEQAITTGASNQGTVNLTGSLILSPSSSVGAQNALDVTVQTLDFDFDTLAFSGTSSFTGPYSVTSSAIISGSLDVIGNTTLSGSLNVQSGVTASLFGTSSWASNSVSSSYALNVDSASYALTSSYVNPLNQDVFITGSLNLTGSAILTGSTTINGLTYPTVDNGEFSFMQTDGLGNLTLQYVNTLYEVVYNGEATQITKGTPVYISGSQGANSIAYRADAGDPTKMPVVYIAADNIDAANTGRAIALGLITGVNTTGYPGGTEIYVGVGGGWTSTRPTGSAIIQILGYVTKEGSGGQGVVLNAGPANLPNILSGSVWVGNSGSVPVAIPTASLSVANAVTASYAQTASFAPNYVLTSVTSSMSVASASVATSASYALTASFALNGGGGGGSSFPYTGSAIISGSLEVTGSTDLLGNVTINTNPTTASLGAGATTTLLAISSSQVDFDFDVLEGDFDLVQTGSQSVTGAVTASYFRGDGTEISGISAINWFLT